MGRPRQAWGGWLSSGPGGGRQRHTKHRRGLCSGQDRLKDRAGPWGHLAARAYDPHVAGGGTLSSSYPQAGSATCAWPPRACGPPGVCTVSWPSGCAQFGNGAASRARFGGGPHPHRLHGRGRKLRGRRSAGAGRTWLFRGAWVLFCWGAHWGQQRIVVIGLVILPPRLAQRPLLSKLGLPQHGAGLGQFCHALEHAVREVGICDAHPRNASRLGGIRVGDGLDFRGRRLQAYTVLGPAWMAGKCAEVSSRTICMCLYGCG